MKTLSDWWLEFRIGMYYHLWAMSDWKNRKHMDRLNQLVRQRSARQVAKMERKRGLI